VQRHRPHTAAHRVMARQAGTLDISNLSATPYRDRPNTLRYSNLRHRQRPLTLALSRGRGDGPCQFQARLPDQIRGAYLLPSPLAGEGLGM